MTTPKDDSAVQRHMIRWELASGDYHPTPRISCESDPGANCRLTCGVNCGSEVYPCGPEEDRHPLVDQGACNAVLFIENDDGVESCYSGPPINSLPRGRVQVAWDYDHWTWEYIDAAATSRGSAA